MANGCPATYMGAPPDLLETSTMTSDHDAMSFKTIATDTADMCLLSRWEKGDSQTKWGRVKVHHICMHSTTLYSIIQYAIIRFTSA